MRQYEVWWASLPSPAGKRPVLLLSRDDAYGYLHKFIAAEITTTVRNIPVEVPVGPAEGLPKRSVVNCDNLRTIARSSLVKRLGSLRRTRQPEVKRAVGYALAWEELIGSIS